MTRDELLFDPVATRFCRFLSGTELDDEQAYLPSARAVDDELRRLAGSRTPDCLLCVRPVRGLADFLCLDVFDPIERTCHLWAFAHPTCCDRLGGYNYGIQLDRIVELGRRQSPYENSDSLWGWIAHLNGRSYFSLYALAYAHTLARRVAQPQNRRRVRSPISPRKRARVMERDGFRCRRCGRRPPEVVLHIDHVVPQAKGGNHADDNLQTLCADCNVGKADNPPTRHDLERP